MKKSNNKKSISLYGVEKQMFKVPDGKGEDMKENIQVDDINHFNFYRLNMLNYKEMLSIQRNK